MKIYSVEVGSLGTNCYMIVSEEAKKAAIIDPADYVSDYAKKLKETDTELVYILLTHGHGDHTGGVRDFMDKFPSAKLAAGADEKTLLLTPSHSFSAQLTGEDKGLAADIWLEDGDSLQLGEISLDIITTPGHTAGGISILAGGEALFSGDTLFRESVGRTDLPTGDYETLIRSIREKLFRLDDSVAVLPGHMGDSTIGFEKRNNPYAGGDN